jgi:Tfp pilus assembly protein PilF
LVLALHLARQKKAIEALALCERAREKCGAPIVATASLAVLRTAQASTAQWQAVERWLRIVIKNEPTSKALPGLLAEVYQYQNRPTDSIALYRGLLKQDPQNVVFLNNLAFLLALHQGEMSEPLKLVNQALELAGPMDELLDTRAVIYLKSEQADLALRDLRQAIAQHRKPMCYFHLAQVKKMALDKTGAADAWRTAVDLGLKATDVHPLERAAYNRLFYELN